MGNVVTIEATALLAASVAGVTYPAPVLPVKLALITTTTPSTATTAGSEVSGGSYARQDTTTSSVWVASGGVITNSAGSTNFINMPACTIGGIELWDSAGTPIRRWFGPLVANKVVNSGDTVTFSPSSIAIQMS